MKILVSLITDGIQTGGEVHAFELIYHADKQGWKTYLLTTELTEKVYTTYWRNRKRPNCEVIKIPAVIKEQWSRSRSTSILSRITSLASALLVKKILKTHFDVAYVAGITFLPDVLPILIAKCKIRAVALHHLFYPPSYRKKRDFLSILGSIEGMLSTNIMKCSKNFYIFTYPHQVDTVINIHKLQRRSVIPQVLVGLNKKPVYSQGPKKEYRGIYVGRLHPTKGLVDMIYAWSEVVKKIPSAELVIAGSGDMKYTEDVIRLSRKLGLNDNVRFLIGYISEQEKTKLISSAACFLLPSYEEGFSISTLESLARGTCVVAYDLPAFNTYYTPVIGHGLYTVPLGDLKSISSIVIDLMLNKVTPKQHIVSKLTNKYDAKKICSLQLKKFEGLVKKGNA